MERVRKIVLVLSKLGGVCEISYDKPIPIEQAEKEIIDDSHYLWILELTDGKKRKYYYGKKQK